MAQLADIWYMSHGANYGRSQHYNDSRYHMLNYHATFTKGTVEFRLSNSTSRVTGAGAASTQGSSRVTSNSASHSARWQRK